MYVHHQIGLNELINMYFIFNLNAYFSRNCRKCSKNGDLKTRIYGSKNISSCRAKNSKYSRVFRLASLSIYLEVLMKMYEKIEYHRMN